MTPVAETETPLTRTAETEQDYLSTSLKLVRRLSASYGRDLSLPDDAALIAELAVRHVKPTLMRNSWRNYRVALNFDLDRYDSLVIEIAHKKLALANHLEPGFRSRSEPPRTSAQKLRRLDLGDLAVLKAYAEREGARDRPDGTDRTGVFTVEWLLLGGILGLRPREWCHAELRRYESQSVLVVQNAKSTNGRGFAEPRILNLDEFPAEMVSAIADFIGKFQRSVAESDYKRLHGRCARWLHRACRFKFPDRLQHIALYTPRHEAAARWKLFYNPSEVAALLGHAADDTAGKHYGRRRAGSSGRKFDDLLPRPAERLVSKVRITGRARLIHRLITESRKSDVANATVTYSP